jgi:hypothetical protein
MRQAEVRFGVLDTDKSGGITPAEFAYSGWRMFVTHDTNKDGAVSAADPVRRGAWISGEGWLSPGPKGQRPRKIRKPIR